MEKETVKPRKRGRKPIAPNGQASAVEEKANGGNANPKVYVQFQEKESDAEALIEAAKADFRNIRKRTRIFDMKLYVKPEENAAYYVINERFQGKIHTCKRCLLSLDFSELVSISKTFRTIKRQFYDFLRFLQRLCWGIDNKSV